MVAPDLQLQVFCVESIPEVTAEIEDAGRQPDGLGGMEKTCVEGTALLREDRG